MVVKIKVKEYLDWGRSPKILGDYHVFLNNNNKRILVTYAYSMSDDIVTRWITELQKIHRKSSQPIFVSLAATIREDYYSWHKNHIPKDPLEYLVLTIGSNCLIYNLPDLYNESKPSKLLPQTLITFLNHPKTIIVGMDDVESTVKKLEKDYRIELKCKTVEIESLVERGLGLLEGYLKGESLDLMVKKVFGKNEMDILRTDEKFKKKYKFQGWYYYGPEDDNFLKFSPVDGYLMCEIANKFSKLITAGASSSKSK